MPTAVKKTISLPPDLARDAESVARSESKTLSAVVQDALRLARRERLEREFQELQGRWSRLAKARGLVTEEQLRRYLAKR